MPFLDTLATEWLESSGGDPLAVSRGMILLPTRRAARSLAEAFLRASGGRPLLLPRITALGALDEAPLTLAGALDLPPAVEPARRLAALTRLILAMQGANGAPRTADRAWPLAAELAALIDEAERAEIDLARRLPEAADPAYAAHWAHTLTFLHIVTRSWPDWLAEQGLMNPAARLVALLDAQAAAWGTAPPVERVLAAGTTGGIPAVARLLRVVARLPKGAVVLPGLDTTMSERAWAGLDDFASAGRSGRPAAPIGRHARRCRCMAWCSARRRQDGQGGDDIPRPPAGCRTGGVADRGTRGGRRSVPAVACRPAGGSRRDRDGVARGARNRGSHRGAGDA